MIFSYWVRPKLKQAIWNEQKFAGKSGFVVTLALQFPAFALM
jgi:hypothetical protein